MSRVTIAPFAALEGGREAQRYVLSTPRGMRVDVTNYGGIVLAIQVPDRGGALDDVVLGYDDLPSYVADRLFHGCLIGRYANRIAHGHLQTPEGTFALAINDGPHHLHGGPHGFHKALWSARPFEEGGAAGVELSHTSPDGEAGYPGTVHADVVYRLTDDHALTVEYRATADRPTVTNFTQHMYFNLAGSASADILDHELTIHARAFTPIAGDLIPTGEVRPVAGTVFDFSRPRRIGDTVDRTDDEQLRFGGGYDHNFVLDGDGALHAAARVRDPRSGRVLEVWTTEPGVQFYSGNSLPASWIGKRGTRHGRRAGLCLETQHFPDSPNKPQFPSTLLLPGQVVRSTTAFRFSVDETGSR
jgi:aldose 1-epimerase